MSRDQSIVHRGHSLQHRDVRSRHPDYPKAHDGDMELMGPGCAAVTGQEQCNCPVPEGGDNVTIVQPDAPANGGAWGGLTIHAYRRWVTYAHGGTWAESDSGWNEVSFGTTADIDVGHAAGNTPQNSPPPPANDGDYGGCAVYFYAYGYRSGEVWYEGTVPAKPAGARGIMFKNPPASRVNQAAYNTYGYLHLERGFQLRISDTAPPGMRSGGIVATFKGDDVEPARHHFISADRLPAEGQQVWFGVVPNWDTIPGHPLSGPSWLSCDFGAQSFPVDEMGCAMVHDGWGNGGDIYWAMDGTVWPPGANAFFYKADVGVGDGVRVTFTGVPTTDGSARWYVDGFLVEPASVDESAGTATFDRAPASGAYIEQSGVGR